MMKLLVLSCAFVSTAFGTPPRDALPLDAPDWPQNYRLHLDGAAKVRLGDGAEIALDANGPHDIAVERPVKGAPVLRVWSGGKLVRGPEDAAGVGDSPGHGLPGCGS